MTAIGSQIDVQNPTNNWLIVSAAIQAGGAVAIAVMTFFIVRFTGRYVTEMREANRLQAAANAISSALLARQAAMEAPFLIASPGGASGTKGGKATGQIQVQNRGGTLAHEIVVDTTWGELKFASLAPGDPPQRGTLLFEGPWDTNQLPEVRRFRFKDPQGTEWVQAPNEMPTRAPSS